MTAVVAPTQSVSVTRTLTQADFDAFAQLSGDDNPIHVDPEFSARTSFGRTVSHGMLLYTVFRGLAERLAPGGRHRTQALKFPAPAYAEEPLIFEAKVTEQNDQSLGIEMRAIRTKDGVCVCEGFCEIELGGAAT